MQRKLFQAFIVLLLIAVLTTGFLTLGLIRGTYLNNVEQRLVSNAKLIRTFLQTEDLETSRLDRLARTYAKDMKARVTFIDESGEVLGDSSAEPKNLENHKKRPEIEKAYLGEIGISQRYSTTLDIEMFYVAVPFNQSKNSLAVIRLALPLKDINMFNTILFKNILIAILAGMVVALILAFRYVEGVTEPIKALTLATRKMTFGNYGQRVYFKSDDELGVLANNFNKMSEALQEKMDELADKNMKTKAILTSMINGVIALDNKKKIMFINPAAEQMFNISEDQVRGKHLLEVVRHNSLDDKIQNMMENYQSDKYEIELHEPVHKILNIHSNPIILPEDPNRKIGMLIILQDMTEMRKLERMRKDFVANVSHELKTPLTSIKGFVETLKSGAAEEKKIRDKFIDIIDIEAERLKSLIEDLLVLSQIENKNSMVKKEKINIEKAFIEVVDMMKSLGEKKEIDIHFKTEENLPCLIGNKGWFKQMLINLVDNGIKYSTKGSHVKISAWKKDRFILISVKDTGIGIDNEHLDRLFERFYRVDKARSRRVGGTGLGLAIVKHIVIAFQGDITVQSEVNKGTEFIVRLPL